MKNIICIDLTKFNNEKLAEVSKSIGVDYNALVENKKTGFAKLFIDKVSGKTIAFTTKSNKDKVVYTSNFDKMLLSITPMTFVKEPKEMTIDGILDKISKYGIESISENEKLFLNSQV